MAGSVSSANVHSYQVVVNNFQAALTNTLLDRCYHLSQLLLDTPTKELQYAFANVVESIFGFHTGVDWGFLTLEKGLQPREFEALRRLVSPDGPLLRTVSRLCVEFNPKFEFPTLCLPVTSLLMLREGKIPTLYANKLSTLKLGDSPSFIQLNAFEFYFYHFSYFLVNPSLKNSAGIVNQQDTLYAHVLEEYFLHFLPTDNRTVPISQSPTQHSPILTSSLSSSHSNVSPEKISSVRRDLFSPPKRISNLLKKGALLMTPSTPSCPLGSGTSESWTSETFVLVLKEMLLNQNAIQRSQSSFIFNQSTFVPSHYHVWMVRIFVKHMHFFFNSACGNTGHGQITVDYLAHLKGIGMTEVLQKEMYQFLKNIFDHWPLDASFRVPLETYLSYIQPWRYTRSNLDSSLWQKFMTENLPFYTSILQQILKRFARMDLSCPKNAYMLFRLTKVICSNEIRDMIMQAEKGSFSKPSNVTGNPRSPEKHILRRVSQMEQSYIPLFSEPVFTIVCQLLSNIAMAQEKIRAQGVAASPCSRSWFSVFNVFETSGEGVDSDDNGSSDSFKASSYLLTSSKQLSLFFPEVPSPVLNHDLSRLHSHTTSLLQDSETSATSNVHASLKRRGPISGGREIEYHGNPDLQPARTYEIACLVHFFNEISQHFNEKYSTQIQQAYYQNNFIGKLCRRILSASLVHHDVVKSRSMESSTWTPVCLPPRVNLRVFANRKLFIYSFIVLLIGYIFGYNPFVLCITSFLIFSVFIALSAILFPVPI